MRLSSLLALPFAFLLLSLTASAQGVPDARTGITLPSSQAAAVEDSTALLINPAGLAFVEGLELSLGAFGRVTPAAATVPLVGTVVDGQLALGGGGLTLGGGLSYQHDPAQSARLTTSLALALALHETLAVGAAAHGISPLLASAHTEWLVDVFTQIRPTRFVALGLGLEGLGDQDLGPTTLRAGISVRPLQEMLTLGLDARLIPGSTDVGSATWLNNALLVPGVVARLDLGGVGLALGASVKNLGLSTTGPLEVEALASVEVNGGHAGATLIGGAGGLGSTANGAGGLRLRASTARWTSILPDSGRWLSIALTGDGVPVVDSEGLFQELFADRPPASYVLAALDDASHDSGVEGVVVRLKGLSLGWGRATELRAALARLKSAGKKVVVHMDAGDDTDIYVASAASQVYLSPAGAVGLDGLRATMVYIGETLGEFGIQAEAVAAGKYKSAPRTFTHDAPSPEELEVENALLDSAFAALTEAIASGRGLTVDEVKAIIDLGGLSAHEALEKKIVDALIYEDEIDSRVEQLAGHPVMLNADFLDDEERSVRWDAPPAIALIPVTGTIQMGRAGGGLDDLLGGSSTGSDDFVEAVENAVEDDSIKAIVVRVDSPGGDALASDLMWRAVMRARDKKPVIATMGDVAASGGYYVASAAHEILAEPDAITGSIGVFGLMFHAQGLADKYGVRAFEVARGARPGPTLFRGPTDAERERLQTSVNNTYERFLEAIIEGRGQTRLTIEALRASAEGRVWTGHQALERKLIDREGSIVDALALARERAGIAPRERIELRVITGHEDDLGRLVGFSAAIVGLRAREQALQTAVRLFLGLPAETAFAVEHAGTPLTLSPVGVRVE